MSLTNLIFIFFADGQSKIFQGNGEKVETALILPDGKKAGVGYADGSIRIFDLKSEEVVHNLNAVFSDKGAVTALASRSDNQLIAAGSAEGEILVINTSNGKKIASFSAKKRPGASPDESSGSNSIESLLFSPPELNQLISADVDGNFTVWDLSSQVAKVSTVLGEVFLRFWVQIWSRFGHSLVIFASRF